MRSFFSWVYHYIIKAEIDENRTFSSGGSDTGLVANQKASDFKNMSPTTRFFERLWIVFVCLLTLVVAVIVPVGASRIISEGNSVLDILVLLLWLFSVYKFVQLFTYLRWTFKAKNRR